jgi:hypothetical protein
MTKGRNKKRVKAEMKSVNLQNNRLSLLNKEVVLVFFTALSINDAPTIRTSSA